MTTALTVSDDTVGCEVRLVTRSAEAAPLLKDVIQGADRHGHTKAGSDPGLTELFDARKIDVADKTVTLTWSAPVADVWSQAERAFEAMGTGSRAKLSAGRGRSDPRFDRAAPSSTMTTAFERRGAGLPRRMGLRAIASSN